MYVYLVGFFFSKFSGHAELLQFVNINKNHHYHNSLQKISRGHRDILGDVGESKQIAFSAAGIFSSCTVPSDRLGEEINREAER